MTDVTLPAGFGQSDPEVLTKAYHGSKAERLNMLFLEAGITVVRILPPHKDEPSWFYEYKEHGMYPEGKFTPYVCPKSIGQACPICEHGSSLYESKTEEDKAAAKSFYAGKKYLYNVYVFSSPKADNLASGIRVLKTGVKVFKQLIDHDQDKAGGYGDISNLTNGWNFRIERKGKGMIGTEYIVKVVPTQTNILEELSAAGQAIGMPYHLSTVLNVKSYAELQQVLETNEPTAG